MILAAVKRFGKPLFDRYVPFQFRSLVGGNTTADNRLHSSVFSSVKEFPLSSPFLTKFIDSHRKAMKLSDFTALCFDMDFTMVNYNLDNFMPFIYQITADYLIDVKGYSSSLRVFEANDVRIHFHQLFSFHTF